MVPTGITRPRAKLAWAKHQLRFLSSVTLGFVRLTVKAKSANRHPHHYYHHHDRYLTTIIIVIITTASLAQHQHQHHIPWLRKLELMNLWYQDKIGKDKTRDLARSTRGCIFTGSACVDAHACVCTYTRLPLVTDTEQQKQGTGVYRQQLALFTSVPPWALLSWLLPFCLQRENMASSSYLTLYSRQANEAVRNGQSGHPF